MPEASKLTWRDVRRALRGEWYTDRAALVIPPSIAGLYAVGGAFAGGWLAYVAAIAAGVELIGVAVLLHRQAKHHRDMRDMEDYFTGLIADRRPLAPLDLGEQQPETD